MSRLFVSTMSTLALAFAASFGAAAQDTELDYDWWDGWEQEEDWSDWDDDWAEDDFGETDWNYDEEWGYDEFGETEWGDEYGYEESDDYGYYDESSDWEIDDEDSEAFDDWFEENEVF